MKGGEKDEKRNSTSGILKSNIHIKQFEKIMTHLVENSNNSFNIQTPKNRVKLRDTHKLYLSH